MTLPIESAVGSLWSALKPAAGASVTYVQDATSFTAYAVPGSTPIEVQTADGAVRTDKTQDFIFKVADLEVTPTRTDTITWGSRTCEVVQPGGSRCYSYVDQYETLIRVHTKETSGG